MREIKFRAWDKINKKMLQKGVKFVIFEDGSWVGVDALIGTPVLDGSYDGVLLEYIGYKDINNKDVYDGECINIKSTEFSSSLKKYKGKMLHVLAIGGTNELSDWLLI